MEKKLGIILFLFVVVVLLLQLSELHTAQRPSQVNKEEEKGINSDNRDWTTQAYKTSDMTQEELMGEEKCEESDEECMKRRMITETHLDYIYTQKGLH